MSDIVLSATGVCKSFGKTVALDGAGLELRRGEHLALLGPNGAGKTTLVRCMAGRVKPSAGDITLLGQSIHDSAAASRLAGAMGVVPQDLAVYPTLTAKENLQAFGTFNGVSKGELDDRIAWALTWTGLEKRADDLSQTFSGGMKRRLNIACGVLHDPEIVLLDEPTVGVDPQSRQRIWEMLERSASRGVSLLLTTHQLDEAQQVCDRIVIIDHGKDDRRRHVR
jgi:ABC-2 type transport system ATP-binding protein